MRMLGIATLAGALAMAGSAAAATGDSGPEQVRGMKGGHGGMKGMHGPRPGWSGKPRWGHRMNGRWHAGWRAPGGWGGYRFAYRGYQLPSYWVAPTYYIGWQSYGLPQPMPGYQWSRYYDDAVMIDQYGRVYDSRRGIDWDRYEGGYDDSDYPYSDDDGYARRDDGAGGAVAGAIVGGIAGNLIAPRGDKLAGTALGAGVGAAAGYAIDRAEDQDRRGPPPGAPFPPPGAHRDGPPPPDADGPPPPPHGKPPRPGGHRLPPPGDYGWNDEVAAGGTWTGTWQGKYADGRPYSYTGSFDGQYRGEAPRGAGAPYPPPHAERDVVIRRRYAEGPPPGWHAPGMNPAIVQQGNQVIINGVAYPAGGTVSGGYYYPPATVTTITVQTQPTTTYTTYTKAKSWKPAPRKRWTKPRAKPRCSC